MKQFILLIFCVISLNVYSQQQDTITFVCNKVTTYTALNNAKTADGTIINKKQKQNIVAISRDLKRKYNINFGDTLIVKGIGTYIVHDLMGVKSHEMIDIFVTNPKQHFFKRNIEVKLIKKY